MRNFKWYRKWLGGEWFKVKEVCYITGIEMSVCWQREEEIMSNSRIIKIEKWKK